MKDASGIWDHQWGYGAVTRSLHWIMALLLAWQFASALLRVFADGSPIERFFWSTHYTIGFTLCVLALLRGGWGILNLRRRRAVPRLPLGRAASCGHFLMHLLMIVVPSLAILRAAGGGRGFSVYGMQVVAAGAEPNDALVGAGNVAHGLLGWLLLALIGGHIAMAVVHGVLWRDGALRRMTRGGLA